MMANELRRRREQLGMTTGQLARVLEVSPATIWRWETGKTKVDLVTALGVDAALKDLERQARRAERPEGGES